MTTALHKDPARRYASAERLADDVVRHLAGRPIEARADSFGYWTRKLLRRRSIDVMSRALGPDHPDLSFPRRRAAVRHSVVP